MAMNTLVNLHDALVNMTNTIEVDEAVRRKALIPLDRMLNFSYEQGILTAGDA
jgi:quinolinate synthase